MAILFYVKDIKYKLSGRKKVKDWIKKVIDLHQRKTGEINIILTGDETLLELNKQFLNRNYYTDILTFDYSNGEKISGDLYISVERIEENSKKFHEKNEKELIRVIIHGILHLIGFDDKNRKEQVIMRRMEEKCMKMIE